MGGVPIKKAKVDVLQGLLDKFKTDDKELVGLVIYHFETEEIIASTYGSVKAKKIVALRRKYAKLGDEAVAEKIYPAGKWRWGITSVGRYKLFASQLAANYVITGEFLDSKSHSACVEDAVALSLMINNVLGGE